MKTSCENHQEAKAITKCYNLDDGNFKRMIKELDRRFLVIRNLLYAEVEKLIAIPQWSGKGSMAQHLKRVYDAIRPIHANITSIHKQAYPKKSDVELKAKMYDGVFAAILARSIDGGTKNGMTSKLHIAKNKIPSFQKMMKFVEAKFTDIESNVNTTHRDNVSHIGVQFKKETFKDQQPKNNAKGCLICKKDNHLDEIMPRFDQFD